MAQLDPNDPTTAQLATLQVRQYHSFLPLDPQHQINNRLPVQSTLFQATSSIDNLVYAVRRIDGPALPSEKLRLSTSWCALQHPNVIRLVEAFNEDTIPANAPQQRWSQRRTYFVHHFYPGAQSIEWLYFTSRSMVATEDGLWNIALSIIAALHAIHMAGAAVGGIDAAHVLMTDPQTIRISSIGVLDALRDQAKTLSQLQVDDLQSLACLLVNVACQSMDAVFPNNLVRSLSFFQATYSSELNNLVMYLLSGSGKGGSSPSIFDVVTLVSNRMMTRMSQAVSYADALYDELGKEAENGRLFRLLSKLSVVCGRDALLDSPDWGTHADRHLLRLFLDSMYQRVDEQGRPMLEFAHIVASLNRLDVAHNSRVLLSGRDEGSLLVVSYADLWQVLERSFDEIVSVASEPPQ